MIATRKTEEENCQGKQYIKSRRKTNYGCAIRGGFSSIIFLNKYCLNYKIMEGQGDGGAVGGGSGKCFPHDVC